MKKLLLLLTLSFFSAHSLGALDVYECEVKINQTVYEDKTYEGNDVDSFIIKFDKNNVTFSEDWKKRPQIVNFYTMINTGFVNDDKSLLITGYNGFNSSYFYLRHDKKDDYALLKLSNLNFDGSIKNLIARCSLL